MQNMHIMGFVTWTCILCDFDPQNLLHSTFMSGQQDVKMP